MDNPKLRKLMILLHLFGAAFMAPAFLLVAVTGGLYLAGQGEKLTTTPIVLPVGTTLDFKSKTVNEDIRAILDAANVDVKVEYLKDRGKVAQTRPTSRTYVEFKQNPDGLTATLNKPNLQLSMMEIHKGHGPKILKTYHKFVALALLLVVFGGIFVGLLAKAYRRKTVVTLVIGTVLYVTLALFA